MSPSVTCAQMWGWERTGHGCDGFPEPMVTFQPHKVGTDIRGLYCSNDPGNVQKTNAYLLQTTHYGLLKIKLNIKTWFWCYDIRTFPSRRMNNSITCTYKNVYKLTRSGAGKEQNPRREKCIIFSDRCLPCIKQGLWSWKKLTKEHGLTSPLSTISSVLLGNV